MSSHHVLDIDPRAEAARISTWLRGTVARVLHKRGLVLGVSGGVDSSVCLGLAVDAVGPERVLALAMPERESSRESVDLAREVAERFGVGLVVEDLTATLEAQGCYRRRDAAISKVVPGYGPGCKQKIVIARERGINFYRLVVRFPDGEEVRVRLPHDVFLEIVAATNMKQRARKAMEYHHADRLNYAVLGTPNRLEYDQGFFVKSGDGAADVKPIAHLYKTQVYALARHYGLPEAIVGSVPDTDTYSLPQTQEEFFFALPYHQMDLALYDRDHGVPVPEAAQALGLTEQEVEEVYEDIDSKRRAAAYLHMPPLTVEPVPSVALARERALGVEP